MAEILETNVPKMSSESYLERYFLLEIFRQFGALQISPLKNYAGLHKDMLLAFTGTKEKNIQQTLTTPTTTAVMTMCYVLYFNRTPACRITLP